MAFFVKFISVTVFLSISNICAFVSRHCAHIIHKEEKAFDKLDFNTIIIAYHTSNVCKLDFKSKMVFSYWYQWFNCLSKCTHVLILLLFRQHVSSSDGLILLRVM